MKTKMLAFLLVTVVAGVAFADSQSIEMQRFDRRTGNTSFLHSEAGMSAYAQLDGTVDLTKAEDALKTVEEATSEYVIGSVGLEGYGESHDVHIYVDSEGWIIAYYLADEKPAKIINWISFSESGSFVDMKVKVALSHVAEQMLLFPSEIKYYDFRYPDATKMMVVADEEEVDNATETFRIKIPNNINIYTRNWSLGVIGSNPSPSSNIKIDGVELHAGQPFYEGAITPSQLSTDEFHEISIYNRAPNPWDNNTTYGAIMLIYKE